MSVKRSDAKEELEHLWELIRIRKDRLRELQKKEALYGISVQPEVVNEIRDLKRKIADLELQATALQEQIFYSRKSGQWAQSSIITSPDSTLLQPQFFVESKQIDILLTEARLAGRTWETERIRYAVKILTQLESLNQSDVNIPSEAKMMRERLEVSIKYGEAVAKRAKDDWKGALEIIESIKLIHRTNPVVEQIRIWAEREQTLFDLLSESERAFNAEDLQRARRACLAGLRMSPEDDRFGELFQVIEQREYADLLKVEGRRQRLNNARVFVEIGNLENALKRVELLVDEEQDSEAIALAIQMVTEREADKVPFEHRLHAARLLQRGADPRPGVCSLPPEWCEPPFPANRYPIGIQPSAGDRTYVTVGEFWIARYPVTVAQFRVFLSEDEGYDFEEHWTDEGRRWKNENAVQAVSLQNQFDGSALNHPVSGINWYEAVAFCNWLTRKAQEQQWIKPDEIICLPTEAEWEIAAKWEGADMRGWRRPPKHSSLSSLSPDEIKQNVAATSIGGTIPVGLFPNSASPCGALDMAGNTWEWCASPFRDRILVTYMRDFATRTPDFLLRKPPLPEEQGEEPDQADLVSSDIAQVADNMSNQSAEPVYQAKHDQAKNDDAENSDDSEEDIEIPAIRGGSYLLEYGDEEIGFGWDARSGRAPSLRSDTGFRLCKLRLLAKTEHPYTLGDRLEPG